MRPNLAEYALRLAEVAAIRSEDPDRKVGAALLRPDGTVVALGYNGPPPGVDLDDVEWDAEKDLYVVHAEANALRFALPGDAWLLASTYRPCGNCLRLAASYGVQSVVYRDEPAEDDLDAWQIATRLGLQFERRSRLD